MRFTTPAFALAVGAILLLYYWPPLRRVQVELLVLASLGFYAVGQGAALVGLLIASWALTAGTAWQVAHRAGVAERRAWAVAGVGINLSVLAAFKYGALIAATLGISAAVSTPSAFLLALPLPVGISFYTFHGVSLLVDVWRRDYVPPARAAQHARGSLLYLVFFPQLIAGPIARARRFLPQVAEKRLRDVRWRAATRALIAGYFLKLCVADHLRLFTAPLDAPSTLQLPAANLAGLLVGFSAQIFADFAGYSLIAVGLAALFGYVLPRNFDRPYAAASLRDFWRRWHRSLSFFLRDYLYRPLGGSRHGAWRTARNILVVMILGGLWHGASWGFALWGLWHGVALLLERGLAHVVPTRVRVGARAVRPLLVFTVVTVGWIFFRFTTLARLTAFAATFRAGMGEMAMVLPLVMLVFWTLPVLLLHVLPSVFRRFHWRAPQLALALDGLMLALIALDAAPPAPFIYFQF